MTYCEGIMWDQLYPKVNKAKYFIAEDAWGDFLLNQPELEVVCQFDIYSQKERQTNHLPYFLLKRKN